MESAAEYRELSFHEESIMEGAGAFLDYVNYVGSYTAGCAIAGGAAGGLATAWTGPGFVAGATIGGIGGGTIGVVWGTWNYFSR